MFTPNDDARSTAMRTYKFAGLPGNSSVAAAVTMRPRAPDLVSMFTANDARSTAMRTYKFARLPSNSSVAAAVTVLVAAWFLVAAGIIIAEKPAALGIARAAPAASGGAPVAVSTPAPAPRGSLRPA
jgi:hypothetical protein